MTRINVGVNPKELPSKLLLAEHREIVRIPNCIKSGRAIVKDIPLEFTLGKGHVKFFYNKLLYLHKRYNLIYQECVLRKFQVSNMEGSFLCDDFKVKNLWNDWEPSQKDRNLILERIFSKGFELIFIAV